MSFTIVVYLIICFLLIAFSLLQQNQSGGMGVLGGSSDTLLGTGQVSFLSKLVAFLAILYFVGSFFLNVISSSENPVLIPDALLEKNQETTEEKTDGGVSDALEEIVSNLPESSQAPSSPDALKATDPNQSSTAEESTPANNQLPNDASPQPLKE